MTEVDRPEEHFQRYLEDLELVKSLALLRFLRPSNRSFGLM